MNPQNDFNSEVQKLLISYMLSDPDSYTKCQNILNAVYFDDRLRSSIRFIMDYAEKYKALPQLVQIKASTGVLFDAVDVSAQHTEWFLTTIEAFARYKALELAVIEGSDMVVEGRGGDLEKRIKDALSISLMQDLGTNYFADPKTRLTKMRDNSNFYSTGWKSLDDKLYGGFVLGGLNIFAAGTGVGKSLFLQNISLNWAAMGKHVVYISLELSEDLIAQRLDAMVSGYGTRQIFTNIDDVALKVRMRGMTSGGSIMIKRLPEGGTTANDLRAFLKEYEIKLGYKPDCLVVDYLDLLYPNNRDINPGDLFVKDKFTSEELRGLLGEWNILGATASQLNRQSVEATEFDHSHISGGISKINTCDGLFGIFGTTSMKEGGKIQIQFLKTRSSSAVGTKLDFRYDPITMLISDMDSEEAEQIPMSGDELRDSLKQKTAPPAIEQSKTPGLDVKGLMAAIQARGSL